MRKKIITKLRACHAVYDGGIYYDVVIAAYPEFSEVEIYNYICAGISAGWRL